MIINNKYITFFHYKEDDMPIFDWFFSYGKNYPHTNLLPGRKDAKTKRERLMHKDYTGIEHSYSHLELVIFRYKFCLTLDWNFVNIGATEAEKRHKYLINKARLS